MDFSPPIVASVYLRRHICEQTQRKKTHDAAAHVTRRSSAPAHDATHQHVTQQHMTQQCISTRREVKIHQKNT